MSYGQKKRKGKQSVLIKQVAPLQNLGSSYFHQTTILTPHRDHRGPPSSGPAYVISRSTCCRAPGLTQPPTCPTRIAAPWAALHTISSSEAVTQTSEGFP